MTRSPLLIFTVSLLGFTEPLAAQQIQPVPGLPARHIIDSVRSLYAAAAYEDALAAIPASVEEPVDNEVEIYRALCLLALGREKDATAAIERLVRAHPAFRPSTAEMSPRMQSLIASVRSRFVPGAAKEAYAEGKTAYESRNHGYARAAFQRTIDLVESLTEEDRQPLADLRLLAGEFLKLSTAATSSSESARPTLPAVPLPVVAPVPVREKLPAWIPPDSTASRTEYVGVVRLIIGEDGKVQSANILKASHPVYDAAVIRAVRDWTYKPGTRGGQPQVTQRDIQIRLTPR